MRFFLIIFFINSITTSHASDLTPKPESSIGYSYGYDSDKNKIHYFSATIESKNNQLLNLNYGISTFDNTTLQYYSLSLSTSPYETMSLDSEFNYTRLPDALENTTMSSTLNLNLENWHFSITPQLSKISFILSANRDNEFDITAKGLAISSSYFGLFPYYLSSHYFQNSFSKKPLFLRSTELNSINVNTINRIRIFSRISELGGNLEQKSASLTVGRYFFWGSFDFTWHYVALFDVAQWLDFPALGEYTDKQAIYTYSGSIAIPIHKRLSTSLSVGRQTLSNNDDTLIFSTFELNYYWE